MRDTFELLLFMYAELCDEARRTYLNSQPLIHVCICAYRVSFPAAVIVFALFVMRHLLKLVQPDWLPLTL